MGYKGCIQPYHSYHPNWREDGESENELKNVNNIQVDVVCPGCHRPRPPKRNHNKLVNINNITICVDGHKVKHDCR
ncbi:MAG TPA: hypothetical protein VJZ70_02710 [Limnochordia bacterium]|nr:hypothetical protein [Limnochordia bacterium]